MLASKEQVNPAGMRIDGTSRSAQGLPASHVKVATIRAAPESIASRGRRVSHIIPLSASDERDDPWARPPDFSGTG